MQLRIKIMLFAILPLLLALSAIALTIHFQAVSLMKQQREAIEPIYRASKKAELKNYVTLAEQAIAPFYDSDDMDDSKIEKVKDILRRLEFGNDGYFFVNDFHGKILVQPNQQEREGKIQLDRRDAHGTLIIQKLIDLAHEGGGFVEYMMEKPSTKKTVPKLAYVIALPKWEWVLGAGIYLDDVDVALEEIDTQVSRNIANTMLWIAVISFLGVAAIFLGLMLNIKERTATDDRLREANAELEVQRERIIIARDEERERIRKNLHDGIQSMLAAIKARIEIAIRQLSGIDRKADSARINLELAKELLTDTFVRLRQIIDDIGIVNPQVGLANELLRHVSHRTADMIPVDIHVIGEVKNLNERVEEVLFLVANEALHNIDKHSGAKKALVRLEGAEHYVKLAISDDGRGFDTTLVNNSSSSHMGLSNMRKRVESVEGSLDIESSASGTTVLVIYPVS